MAGPPSRCDTAIDSPLTSTTSPIGRSIGNIETLLKAGLTVNQGIAAAAGLFGRSLNMLDTAKAIAWFKVAAWTNHCRRQVGRI
jgi:hypothetical protein